jgi:hypothetical protein
VRPGAHLCNAGLHVPKSGEASLGAVETAARKLDAATERRSGAAALACMAVTLAGVVGSSLMLAGRGSMSRSRPQRMRVLTLSHFGERARWVSVGDAFSCHGGVVLQSGG